MVSRTGAGSSTGRSTPHAEVQEILGFISSYLKSTITSEIISYFEGRFCRFPIVTVTNMHGTIIYIL